jgi:hypothetical protein
MACALFTVAGFENCSSNALIDAAFVFWTIEETLDRAMLRHTTLPKVSFIGDRRRPLINTDWIGSVGFRKGERTTETSIVTFEAFAR